MKNIKIISSGKYIPKNKITNEELENKYNVEKNYIYKRTGIKQRYYAEENIEELAIESVNRALEKIKKTDIDLIIVATTTTNSQMPGISYKIQKYFNIKNCMCMDILAGCSGFINAMDIAVAYIQLQKIKTALVVGVEKLSDFVNKEDIGTEILFSDGAGTVLITATEEKKQYNSYIVSEGQKGDILICENNQKMYMNGKEIYKYAIRETVESIKKLLEKSNTNIEEIKYIIPHQSNLKIMKSIARKLNLPEEKMYMNIDKYGNTFCASIPIAIDEMLDTGKIKKGDKVILLGYGGGLNTGSILIEI